MYGAIDLNPLDSPRSSGRLRHAGGSVALLLSERALPRLRPARAGQLDGLRPLRQGPSTPDAVLPHLQGAVLRAHGTPLFGSQLTEEKALSIFEHLAERTGVRATARLVKVNRNTVVRYSRLAGDHARQLHDELVAFSPQHPRGPVRREVVVRLQEAGALRPG